MHHLFSYIVKHVIFICRLSLYALYVTIGTLSIKHLDVWMIGINITNCGTKLCIAIALIFLIVYCENFYQLKIMVYT